MGVLLEGEEFGAVFEGGGFAGVGRTAVVAFDPDSVGRVCVFAVQDNVLVAVEGVGVGGAVVQSLAGNLGASTILVERWVQPLEECSRRVEKDLSCGRESA